MGIRGKWIKLEMTKIRIFKFFYLFSFIPNCRATDDMYADLKKKLGIPVSGRRLVSASSVGKHNNVNNKLNSWAMSYLLAAKHSDSESVSLCLPSSLKEWRKKNNLEEIKAMKYGDGAPTSTCLVTIRDLSEKAKAANWDALNQQIEENKEFFKQYPKGTRPPTMSTMFRKNVAKLADKYLIIEEDCKDILSKVAFFKGHPEVNEHLLQYSAVLTTLVRKDCTSDIPNPIEVDDVFFNKQPKGSASKGDYTLYIMDGDHNTTQMQLSNDPEESKLDYHREDSLYHTFHALFHQIHGYHLSDHIRYPRAYELFFYAHQQMLRRAAVEREVLGIKPVDSLNPQKMRLPLGPGYKSGWYSWEGLGGRIDNCEVGVRNNTFLPLLDQKYTELMGYLQRSITLEQFEKLIADKYHNRGHNMIGLGCSDTDNDGLMSYSEASARDPIFYRWHSHIEDIVQQFKDKEPLYTQNDFPLHDGVEVVNVATMMSKNLANTEDDVRNMLITHWEHKTIHHSESSTISYDRLNHLDFKYEIQVKNTNKITENVYIRLWLGIMTNKDDLSSYQSKFMIEMDGFAHRLTGEDMEIIERQSTQSAATMKNLGTTIKSLIDTIRSGNTWETTTWCGYPHNLLLPRSDTFKPEENDLGARKFVLMAFVTSTDNDVIAGTDGVEHVLCGHRDINTKVDGRPFGFPFDKQLGFKLTKEHKFVTMEGINIVYRPENINQEEVGRRLNNYNKGNRIVNKIHNVINLTHHQTEETTKIVGINLDQVTTEIKPRKYGEHHIYEAPTDTPIQGGLAIDPKTLESLKDGKERLDKIWDGLLKMMEDNPQLTGKWLQ